MNETLPTKQKLANAIREFNPELTALINLAESGYYDDYESTLAMPCRQLVEDLQKAGAHDLAKRAMNGEFDGTKEEAEAWFQKEGKGLIFCRKCVI